jgi:hypothetical protein
VGAELMGVDFTKIGYLSYCAKAVTADKAI